MHADKKLQRALRVGVGSLFIVVGAIGLLISSVRAMEGQVEVTATLTGPASLTATQRVEPTHARVSARSRRVAAEATAAGSSSTRAFGPGTQSDLSVSCTLGPASLVIRHSSHASFVHLFRSRQRDSQFLA